MKKIPTLFNRIFEGHKIVDITDEITPGCYEAFKEGIATVKIDGSCCAVIDGVFYKRYDAKNGKKPPEGAIPCCDPDPVTGHWPHWVRVDENDPNDRWFVEAYNNTIDEGYNIIDDIANEGQFVLKNSTYEAIGPHFNGNPHGLSKDTLEIHGNGYIRVERTFEGVKEYLTKHKIEGVVFWLNGEPVCKIKRTDFGLKWPVK